MKYGTKTVDSVTRANTITKTKPNINKFCKMIASTTEVTCGQRPKFSKIYEDPIYGTIELPPIVQAIIETKLFQRLREVHQLGFLPKLYPDANITRFEHCIGTYHAATRQLDALQEHSTAEGQKIFSRSDWPHHKLAVQLAALLHDVGHGPFSHLWETICEDYKHEDVGVECVSLIFEVVDLSQFSVSPKLCPYVIELIKALIVGEKALVPEVPSQFQFIFEIVHNQEYKADVDKWDYLRRDHNFLRLYAQQVAFNADIDDVFLKSRISDDGAHIEYRYEDAQKFYWIFELRFNMWRSFYDSLQNRCRDAMFVTMLQRCVDVPQIGTLPVTVIRPRHPEFLELHDRRLLEFLVDDPWYTILTSPGLLPRAHVNSSDAENVLRVRSEIPAPSAKMPSSINFYGSPSAKPKFTMIETDYESQGDFAVPI